MRSKNGEFNPKLDPKAHPHPNPLPEGEGASSHDYKRAANSAPSLMARLASSSLANAAPPIK